MKTTQTSISTLLVMLKSTDSWGGAKSTLQYRNLIPNKTMEGKISQVGINTILNKLFSKGYLNRRNDGAAYLYFLSELGKKAKQSILSYVFEDSFHPFCEYFEGMHSIHLLKTLVLDKNKGFSYNIPQIMTLLNEVSLLNYREHDVRGVIQYLTNKGLIGYNQGFYSLTPTGVEEYKIFHDFIQSHSTNRLTTQKLHTSRPTQLMKY